MSFIFGHENDVKILKHCSLKNTKSSSVSLTAEVIANVERLARLTSVVP